MLLLFFPLPSSVAKGFMSLLGFVVIFIVSVCDPRVNNTHTHTHGVMTAVWNSASHPCFPSASGFCCHVGQSCVVLPQHWSGTVCLHHAERIQRGQIPVSTCDVQDWINLKKTLGLYFVSRNRFELDFWWHSTQFNWHTCSTLSVGACFSSSFRAGEVRPR